MSSIFGTNMFTYCNNNPVNQIDPEGEDAIWLQDIDDVYYMGHASLLIEDALGVWWFTYWGDKYIAAYPYGNGTVSEFKSFINWGFDPRPHRNYYVKAYYSGEFENLLYFKGNFSLSLYFYIGSILSQGGHVEYTNDGRSVFYSNKNDLYNLLFNNCVQTCLDALNMGYFYFGDGAFKCSFPSLRNTIIPNAIYIRLCKLMPWSLIIFNDWYL